MFSKADVTDLGFMLLGSLAAIATGLTLPIFNILFGKLNDKLNEGSSGFTEGVNQICLIIACASVANIITAIFQVVTLSCYCSQCNYVSSLSGLFLGQGWRTSKSSFSS